MKSLRSFIDEGAEEKKPDKLRILVVSSANKKSDNKLFYTARRITEEGKKLGYEVFVVDILGAFITYEEVLIKFIIQMMILVLI